MGFVAERAFLQPVAPTTSTFFWCFHSSWWSVFDGDDGVLFILAIPVGDCRCYLTYLQNIPARHEKPEVSQAQSGWWYCCPGRARKLAFFSWCSLSYFGPRSTRATMEVHHFFFWGFLNLGPLPKPDLEKNKTATGWKIEWPRYATRIIMQKKKNGLLFFFFPTILG